MISDKNMGWQIKTYAIYRENGIKKKSIISIKTNETVV